MKFFETKEFKKLDAEWRKKLEKSGFSDAEQSDGNLKIWHSLFFHIHTDPTRAAAKEEYYRMANHLLEEAKFGSKAERVIWELHCEGVSLTNITNELKKRRFRSWSRAKVRKVVQSLSKPLLDRCKSKT